MKYWTNTLSGKTTEQQNIFEGDCVNMVSNKQQHSMRRGRNIANNSILLR